MSFVRAVAVAFTSFSLSGAEHQLKSRHRRDLVEKNL
jgi:hypothetical protein